MFQGQLERRYFFLTAMGKICQRAMPDLPVFPERLSEQMAAIPLATLGRVGGVDVHRVYNRNTQ